MLANRQILIDALVEATINGMTPLDLECALSDYLRENLETISDEQLLYEFRYTFPEVATVTEPLKVS
jgi:hypothetical protein